MYRLVCILLLITSLAACSNTDSKSEETIKKEAAEVAQKQALPPPPAELKGTQYESIAQEQMQYMWDNCDQIDFVFLELPFSMSAQEPTQAKSYFRHISVTPAFVRDDFEPLAKVYYQVKGEVVLEADFYFDLENESARYYVFYEDNKPAYANYIVPEAQAYYTRVLTQVAVQEIPQQ